MSFPHDLFFSHIIPDILSEYLHQMLVEDSISMWNPFYTLPLVSREFNHMCRIMRERIFGVENQEEDFAKTITFVIKKARKYWGQARLPSRDLEAPILDEETLQPIAYAQLISCKCLIQVYICTAIAQCFFKYDVQWFIDCDKDPAGLEPEYLGTEWTEWPRRHKMPDDNMHRVYLPLTCAIMLCDDIRPDRLTNRIVTYLATIVPIYSTVPVLLKYAQDLETYVSRRHKVDMETWITWAHQTLHLVKDSKNLLKEMFRMGKQVRARKTDISIPLEVVEDTRILTALDDIINLEWGSDTDRIRRLAEERIDELMEGL